MSVIGYILVEENTAEAEQRDALQAYAASLGLHIDSFSVEEGASQRRPFGERLQGSRILEELESGDILLAQKAAWLLSSASEGLRLLDRLGSQRVSLYCADIGENLSLPAERKLMVYEGGASLIRRLLTSLAACESSSHGDSIKAAKRQMKKEGRYLGGPVPFGWQVRAGFLVKDAEQQKIIRKIQRLRSERWSYRDISRQLEQQFGVQLSHEGIRKILLYHEMSRKAA